MIPELTIEGAPELRDAAAAQADRLSIEFGKAPASVVGQWHYFRGQWRLSWVWLIPGEKTNEAGDTMLENRGFHLWLDGGKCLFSAWSPAGRMNFHLTTLPSAARLDALLDAAFDIQLKLDVSGV